MRVGWHTATVPSRSARVSSERPFYDLHAKAYDALITDSVEPWVQAVDERLQNAGLARASLLDAGCGTGRHAEALRERGHRVTLLDASERLLEIAKRRCPTMEAHWSDICAPNFSGMFDAITCRGVLNDLVSEVERNAALVSFASHLKNDGLLFLDVRETVAAKRRADGVLRRVSVAVGDGSTLAFSSRPTWRADRLLVEERYELGFPDRTTLVHEYQFEMRPWARSEVERRLAANGFTDIQGEFNRSTQHLVD